MSARYEKKIRRHRNGIVRQLQQAQVIQLDKHRIEASRDARKRWLISIGIMVAVTVVLGWWGNHGG